MIAEAALEVVFDREAEIRRLLPLAHRAAAKFYRGHSLGEDVRQEAVLELIRAVDAFDPKMGIPIEAYAWKRILGGLMHWVRDRERLVRVPRTVREAATAIRQAIGSFVQEKMREPTEAEILGMGFSENQLADWRGFNTASNENLGDIDGDRAGAVPMLADDVDERLDLEAAFAKLEERDRRVLLMEVAGLTQDEIAVRMGISRKRVSQLRIRAVAFLRRMLGVSEVAQASGLSATEMGRLGGLRGGRARATALSPEARHDQASNAAKARWSNRKGDTDPAKIERNAGMVAARAAGVRVVEIAHRFGVSVPTVYLALSNASR